MNDGLLTTSDNPWNPYTHWDEWYAWDIDHGYGTCAYLARIAPVHTELPDETEDKLIQEAIMDIIARDLISVVTGGEVHYTLATPPSKK